MRAPPAVSLVVWSVTALAVALGVGSARAATIRVTNTSDSGPGSLRSVIAAAKAGDVVVVPAGHYLLTSGEIKIPSSITVHGAGRSTVIDGGGLGRVFLITNATTTPVRFERLEVTGGNVTVPQGASDDGGAAIADAGKGGVSLRFVTVTRNTVTGGNDGTDVGGAIFELRGPVTLVSSRVTDNSLILDGAGDGSGGAGVYNEGSALLSLTRTSMTGNTVSGLAGGIDDGGGAIFDASAARKLSVSISGGSLSGNHVSLTGSNGDSGGGAIYSGGADVRITGATLNSNSATLSGLGDVYENGGGAIYFNGTNLTLKSDTLDRNSASNSGAWDSGGGAIFIENASMSLTASTVSQNKATITDNAGGGGGGAIYNDGEVGDVVTLLNDTISDNTLRSAKGRSRYANIGGGAIHNGYSATATFSFVTLARNRSNRMGGAIINTDKLFGSVILRGTLITGNSAPSCVGRFRTGGYNLQSATRSTCGLTGANDRVGVNPLVAPLANNGGRAPTQALLPGSPAIDTIPLAQCIAISGARVTFDERGIERPQGAGCDIGAYEAVPANAALTPRRESVRATP